MAIENPLVSVLCALLPDGPFSWVELREPARGGSQLASRLLLVPRYETSHFDLATWFGRGEPYHLDLRDKPVATVAYPFDKRSLYVTYDVTDQRTLRGFAVHGR